MSVYTSLMQVFWETVITTISGLLAKIPYIIIFIWGIKKIPSWIEQYDKVKMKHYRIEQALAGRNKQS